ARFETRQCPLLSTLQLPRLVCYLGQNVRQRLRPAITLALLEMDVAGYAVKVTGRIPRIIVADIWQTTDDAIDRLVGKLFSRNAAAAFEEDDQTAAQRLVLLSCFFAIRSEPGEEQLERLRGNYPVLHR